jgi:uncharacterized membrane protein
VAFVAGLAVSIVMVPLAWVLMIPTILIGGGLFSGGHDANAGSCFGVFALMLTTLVWVVMITALMLALVPLKIRASLTQDFAKSFDLGFVKQFVALTWKEIVISSLFVMITGVLFFCLGLIAFCVGVYFATVLVYFSWTHLQKQLYALYLSRGGEPVPLSSKLNDAPPAMPGA